MSYSSDDLRVLLNQSDETLYQYSDLAEIFQEEMEAEQLRHRRFYRPAQNPLLVLPAYLILGVDGYSVMLNHMEEQMDEMVNPNEIIVSILDAIRQEQFALQELEYHCLGLLEEAALGHMYHWFEPMVDYIHYVGQELHRGLRDNGGYQDGEHPYHLHQLRTNGVYLQRKDLFQKEAQKELDISHDPHRRLSPTSTFIRPRGRWPLFAAEIHRPAR